MCRLTSIHWIEIGGNSVEIEFESRGYPISDFQTQSAACTSSFITSTTRVRNMNTVQSENAENKEEDRCETCEVGMQAVVALEKSDDARNANSCGTQCGGAAPGATVMHRFHPVFARQTIEWSSATKFVERTRECIRARYCIKCPAFC